jgi:hypothetical protein
MATREDNEGVVVPGEIAGSIEGIIVDRIMDPFQPEELFLQYVEL